MLNFRLKIYLLVLILFTNECVSAPEPMCTKFSYDELLLEKMVRMEFNVKTMENNMLETQKSVQETQKSVQETQESVQETQAKLTETLKIIEDRMKQLEQKEESFMDKINKELSDGKSQNGPVVAFHAQTVEDKSLAVKQVIKFTKVNMNEGSGYDVSNGKFTAPVSGIYHFTSHLCVYNKKDLQYVIVVNDTTWSSGLWTGNGGDGRCLSFSVTLRMRSRERAWVTIDQNGSSSASLLYEDSDDWNYFSGFLIRQID